MAAFRNFMMLVFLLRSINGFVSPDILPKPILNNVPCEALINSELDLDSNGESSFNSNDSYQSQTLIRKRRDAIIRWPTAPGAPSRLVSNFYINIPMPHPGTVFMPLTFQGAYSTVLPTIDLGFGDKGRSLSDRFTLFKLAADLMDHFGADGHSCVLRAICERSEYHVLVDGLIGEIFTLLLEIGDTNNNATYSDYEEAEYYGRTAGGCHKKYYTCHLSIFNWFDG